MDIRGGLIDLIVATIIIGWSYIIVLYMGFQFHYRYKANLNLILDILEYPLDSALNLFVHIL